MGQTTEPSWKLWLLPLVVVTAGVIFPVWWWTIPNWSTFARVVHHFDVFWQIGSNRQVILLLVLKVISPLPITLLLLLVLWLWYLAQPLLSGASAASGETESDVVTSSQGVLRESSSLPGTAATATPSLVVTAHAACEESVPTAHLTSEGEHTERTPHLAHVQEQLTDAEPELSLLPHETALMQQTSRAALDEPETPGPDAAAILFDPIKKTWQDRSGGDSAAVRKAFSSSTPSKNSASSIVEEHTEVPPVTMTIWLLARVRVAVHIGEASLPVSLPENAKRTLLLAYVASRCGEPVLREKLLEEVFGHGRADEQASPEKLGELFDSHKKLLRREVRATVKKLGASLGIQVPADKIDPFELLPGSRYRLAPWCRVVDLAEIEAEHQIIEAASRDGLLEDHVPEAVKAACDRLLTAYTGDFLEDLLTPTGCATRCPN